MSGEFKMQLDRRTFLGLTAGAAASTLVQPVTAATLPGKTRVQAIAFDAFPVLDPRPVSALTEELFPGHGTELSNAWRTRQFEYTWLRTAGDRYVDFWQVTEEALVFAARSLKLDLDAQRRERATNAFLHLKAWPDASETLKALQASGIRMAFLSNFSRRMLEAGVKDSGLNGVFEHLLSTDEVKQFKPAPRAYEMAVNAFKLKREEIVFAAFAGWDAAGAKWFGFPTVWVNRLNAPTEELSIAPDFICKDLSGLATFVNARR